MLVQVKQVMGFYRVFITKIGGGGVCTRGECKLREMMRSNYISGPHGFTTLPNGTNAGYVENYEG